MISEYMFLYQNVYILPTEREFRRRDREGHLGRAPGQREVCVEHIRRGRGQSRGLPQRSQPNYVKVRSQISLIHIFATPSEGSGLCQGVLQLERSASGYYLLSYHLLSFIEF